MKSNTPLLKVKNLTKHFSIEGRPFQAIDQISFDVETEETFALIGESGCGKTTLAKTIMGIYHPTQGEVFFKETELLSRKKEEKRQLRKEIQYIFQDPYASLNPRMTTYEIISEPLAIHQALPKSLRHKRVEELLHLVGLKKDHAFRYPHEFSGGQRQRISIARALVLNPSLIICDEPLAALDVSIQAQIVNLLKTLQKELGLTTLFISHDLTMVRYLSSKMLVMYLGKMMEKGPTPSLFKTPYHPYTQVLFDAIPHLETKKAKKKHPLFIQKDNSLSYPPKKGCVFCPRCPKALPICQQKEPPFKEVSPNHFVACHLYP